MSLLVFGLGALALRSAQAQEPLLTTPGSVSTAARVVANSDDVFVKPVLSEWYTRADYFHWSEWLDGAEFCHEDGLLMTVGYARRTGIERFRFEAFGGSVDYGAYYKYDDFDPGQTIGGTTNYAGVRGEVEFLLESDWFPRVTFFGGVGARFWMRSLSDVPLQDGTWLTGYQETWWTVYPYIGLETRRDPAAFLEWFAAGRVGLTAFTYEYISLDDLVLHPRPGFTGQIETGVRGPHFLCSVFLEAMSWNQSNKVSTHPDYWGYPSGWEDFQPLSIMFTAGLRAGFSY